MGTLPRPMIFLLATLTGMVLGEQCNEPSIDNGVVVGTQTLDAYFGRVSCLPGFQLVGSGRIKCRRGRWSPMELPVCAAPGSCPPLPKLPRGRSVPVRGSRGAAMRFKCRHGYKLYGERSTFCNGDSWSHKALPACVSSSCDETGRMVVPYGEARALLGGAVYKYRCNSGLEMDGPDTVFCEGENWNSSVPTCLVPPATPQLDLPELVEEGEEIDISCTATDGNPLPKVSLSLDGTVLGSSSLSFTTNFVAANHHHDQEIVCEASSRAGVNRVTRLLHVLSAPLTASVDGPSILHHGKDYTYTCAVEGGRPTPEIRWKVVDSSGEERIKEGEVVTVRLEEGVRWVDVECFAENRQGSASGKMRGHVHFLPQAVEVSSDLSASTPSSSLTFTCAAFKAFPAPKLLWRAEIAGEKTIVLEEEGEMTTKTEEDGTVSSFASLKVEVGPDAQRVRAECRALDDQLGERRSQWRVVPIYPPLSSAKLEGLHEGAKLNKGDVIPLSCEIQFTHEAEFLTWMVDGEIQGEDYHPVRQGDLLVSSYQFLPQPGQTQVECRPNGQEELSAKVSFAISEDSEEDAAKEKGDEVFWVPHQSDATDYVTEDEDEEMLELRLAEEEFRRAEMVEEVAAVGRQNTDFKVEEEIGSNFDHLILHSDSPSLKSLSPLTFTLLVLVSLLLRGN